MAFRRSLPLIAQGYLMKTTSSPPREPSRREYRVVTIKRLVKAPRDFPKAFSGAYDSP